MSKERLGLRASCAELETKDVPLRGRRLGFRMMAPCSSGQRLLCASTESLQRRLGEEHEEIRKPNPLLPYLGKVFNLFQPFFDLEASPVARDPVHHGHHRLFDHLPADEALQHLGDLQTISGIPSSQLLHLRGQEVEVKWAKCSKKDRGGFSSDVLVASVSNSRY